MDLCLCCAFTDIVIILICAELPYQRLEWPASDLVWAAPLLMLGKRLLEIRTDLKVGLPRDNYELLTPKNNSVCGPCQDTPSQVRA